MVMVTGGPGVKFVAMKMGYSACMFHCNTRVGQVDEHHKQISTNGIEKC